MNMCCSVACTVPIAPEDAERHRQVESRAFLADVGRGQVDGDAFIGIAEAGVEQRAI